MTFQINAKQDQATADVHFSKVFDCHRLWGENAFLQNNMIHPYLPKTIRHARKWESLSLLGSSQMFWLKYSTSFNSHPQDKFIIHEPFQAFHNKWQLNEKHICCLWPNAYMIHTHTSRTIGCMHFGQKNYEHIIVKFIYMHSYVYVSMCMYECTYKYVCICVCVSIYKIQNIHYWEISQAKKDPSPLYQMLV